MTVIISGTDGVSDVDGDASTPAIRGTDTNTGIFFGSDIIGFSEGGTECGRFNASGNLQTIGTISVGNATPSTSGAGITFPASQSASTNANTLDDYEEGTWTPVLAFGGASAGITYNSRGATYTKIGRQVTINVAVSLTNKGSSAGAATLTGLPFTALAVTQPDLNVGITMWENAPAQSAGNTPNYIIQNTATLNFFNTSNTDFANNTTLRLTITYFTS